jgi:hypothetical protein
MPRLPLATVAIQEVLLAVLSMSLLIMAEGNDACGAAKVIVVGSQ